MKFTMTFDSIGAADRPSGFRALQRVAAVGTVALAAYSAMVFPSHADLAPGWRTPIMAFELARTEADLQFLRGAGAAELRAAMDAGQAVDVFFPWMYGSLLIVSAVLLKPRAIAALGVFAAMWAIGSDLWENQVIHAITSALAEEPSGALPMTALFVATWSKWGAIAVSLAAIAVGVWSAERRTAMVLLVAAATVPFAGLSASPLWGELMAAGVALGFLALALRALRGV